MTRLLILLALLSGCATPPRAEVSVEYRVEQEQPTYAIVAKASIP